MCEMNKRLRKKKHRGEFKEIGFDAIQFHDDDAVPNMNNMTEEEIIEEAKKYGIIDEIIK